MKEFFQHRIQNILNIQKIVTIHYFEFPANYKFKGESHNFWELVYSDGNNVLVTQNGTEILLESGELIIHQPNIFHKIQSIGKTCSVFVISFVCTSKSLYRLGNNFEKYVIDSHAKHYISNIIAEADKTFELPTFFTKNKKLELLSHPVLGGMQMIKLNLEMLLITLLRSQKDISTPPEHPMVVPIKSNEAIVDAIKDYLAQNIYNKIDLENISHYFNYGKTFLCTKFKKETGLTIFQYFSQLKIREAKKLIRENKYTFAQLADILNFSSPSHFATAFEKYAKVSLSQYRNSVKN